jgi:hypothetical protein
MQFISGCAARTGGAMTTYYIQNNLSSDKVEATLSEVADMMQNGLDGLKAIEAHNDGVYAKIKAGDNNTPFYFTWTSSDRLLASLRLYRLDTMTVGSYESSQAHTEQVDQFNAALKTAIFNQQQALTQLRNGVGVNISFFKRFQPTDIGIVKGFAGLLCKDCGAVVSEKIYKQHLKSLNCMTQTANRDLRDQGYVELSSGPDIAAVRAAGVDIEFRPSGYSIWAPPWVGNAIDAYRANQGFAGMKMGEFITRMKPSEDKQG